jgi:hypothetical protein
VQVNTVVQCGAMFETEAPDPLRTLLATYSAAGEVVGRGGQERFGPANSRWSATGSTDGSSVSFDVTGLGSDGEESWHVRLDAPTGSALATGSYLNAVKWPDVAHGSLVAHTNRSYCSDANGRFEVLEAEFASDGSIVRFAADLEQHCASIAPPLFLALRYNSTIAATVPFGDVTPRQALLVTSPHGIVAGGGVSCGGGQTACRVDYPSVTWVTLTATPEAGYVFTGWTGACAGAAVSTVFVNTFMTCGATYEPLVPDVSRTLVLMDSQPGDYIGDDGITVYSPANASITVMRNTPKAVTVNLSTFDTYWTVTLASPEGTQLAAGAYGFATRYPFTKFTSLDVSGHGRGCNQLTGRFVVLEAEYGPDGHVERFAADIEQHCEDRDPGLFVAVRYNSTLPAIPFDGQYPRYALSVPTPAHGRVVGDGLACGGGETACATTFSSPTHVTFTARPDPGYIFMGWTGGCSGGPTTTVNVNMVKDCGATFAADDGAARKTVLFLESTPGNYVGAGEHYVYSAANSLWSVTAGINGNSVMLRVDGVGARADAYWNLEFHAAGDLTLAPGSYVAQAGQPGSAPWMNVSGNSTACTPTGTFTVHEFTIDPSSFAVTALALDFEQRCSGETERPLFGTIRFNSAVPLPVRQVWITSSPALPVVAWTTVTFSASASPDVGADYAFWRYEGAGFTLVQPYSARSTYTWMPTSGDVGPHSLQVWVRRAGSTAAYDAWNGMTFTVGPQPAPTVVSFGSGAPALVGGSSTWTAVATGGNGPLQYQFWKTRAGAWTLAQDYSFSNTYTWTPTAADLGPNSLQVWVRNAGSAAPYDAYRGATFEVRQPDPVRFTGVTTNAPASGPTGQRLSWTAQATGGIEPLVYQFWRRDPDGWRLVRDYSTSPTYAWIPGASDVGEHVLQVWARPASSTASYEAWIGFAFALTSALPVTITSLSPTTPPPLRAGVQIGWQAIAQGGVAPLQYQFWRFDADGWHMVQDYGSSPSYYWTPGLQGIGSHALQVWVRSAGSTTAYDAWRGVTFEVAEPAITIGQFSSIGSFPLVPGRRAVWTVSASGGIYPLEYQFWRQDPGGWTLVKDYSTASTYEWTPEIGDVGPHALQVWIRNAGSKKTYDAWAGTGTFLVNPQ